MAEDYSLEPFEKPSEAEQAFTSTTSKKNLSGVRGRASRTGRKGAVMTPVDFLRGKDKKEYMKNSEVRVYNMYDEQVLPYEEFKELPVDKQVVLMTKWREDVGTNNIIKEMKISRKKFYSEVLKNLGIETKPRGRRPKKEEEAEAAAANEPQVQQDDRDEKEGLMLLLAGKYDGQTLANRFARLARVFDNNGEYEIKVEVRETSR
ncbi:MAG: hypothetical protein SCK29_05390 [Bacillota bacterium]|nr:hypothetical protein [Bacillota bacterium]MDW7683537.1 hypothetical protein [Bacillota bacterium]